MWRGRASNEAQILASACRETLALAVAHGCRSLPFPAISCGVYRDPIDLACETALATIRDFCDREGGLEEVLLVAFDPKVADTWRPLGVAERTV